MIMQAGDCFRQLGNLRGGYDTSNLRSSRVKCNTDSTVCIKGAAAWERILVTPCNRRSVRQEIPTFYTVECSLWCSHETATCLGYVSH
jgi:hypothetical protein